MCDEARITLHACRSGGRGVRHDERGILGGGTIADSLGELHQAECFGAKLASTIANRFAFGSQDLNEACTDSQWPAQDGSG